MNHIVFLAEINIIMIQRKFSLGSSSFTGPKLQKRRAGKKNLSLGNIFIAGQDDSGLMDNRLLQFEFIY